MEDQVYEKARSPHPEVGMQYIPPHRRASVGRVVRYQGVEGAPPHAAVITAVNQDGTVDIGLIQTTHKSLTMAGPDGTTPVVGCWNWPQGT